MNNKKKILHKFTSLFLAILMIAQIFFSSLDIFALNSGNVSSNNDIENSNTLSNNMEISAQNISDDNWELELSLFDNDVDKGTTPLTEINWNETELQSKKVITLQMIYKNTNPIKSYQPGELSLTIPDLLYPFYELKTHSDSYLSISADKKETETKEEEWSYERKGDATNGYYYEFTNNNEIIQGANFIGSIQMVYTLSPRNYAVSPTTVTFTAQLGNTESNSVIFNYEAAEMTAKLDVTAEKIKSFDGLPSGDYIWIQYKMQASAGVKGIRQLYGKSVYFLVDIPSDCVVLDKDQQIITPIENTTYKITNISDAQSGYYQYSKTGYIYVGYPTNQYKDQTLSFSADLYGYYYNKGHDSFSSNAPRETKYITSDSTEPFNINDFIFTYTGELYSLDVTAIDSIGSNPNSVLMKNAGDQYRCGHRASAVYTGKTMTIRTGQDMMGILNSNNNYQKLTEDEYYIYQIKIPQMQNGNGVKYETNKYEIALYVRYANTSEYVQYGNLLSNSSYYQYIYFKENEHVVAWYIEVKDINESFYQATVLESSVRIIKPDVDLEGKIYNFGYLFVYDDQGSLLNEATIDNYASLMSKEEIATYDQNTYGKYIQRGCDYIEYTTKITGVGTSIYFDSITPNKQLEYFKTNVNLQAVLINETNISLTDSFKGYEMYSLLPAGIDVIGVPQIKNSWQSQNILKIKKADGTYFSTYNEYFSFIEEHMTYEINQNWNNTGRTRIKIIVDLANAPLNHTDLSTTKNVEYYTEWFMETFSVPIKLSYDSYLEYGHSYKTYVFGHPLYENYYNGIMSPYRIWNSPDNGSIDPGTSDINENNDTDEVFIYGQSTLTVNEAISTHQDITTLVQTDLSNYSTDLIGASPSSEYNYKLRVRTAVNDITNLILYNNIESAYEDNDYWQGEFLGIDTSSANAMGYNVITYYATSVTNSSLYDTNGNKNSIWNIYNEQTTPKTSVKSLAFEFLDANGNPAIINADSIVYVLINMKSPNEELKIYAYNNSRTEWVALDDYGQPVEGIVGISSNTTRITTSNYFDIIVDKIWEDENNKYNTRPDSIDITLKLGNNIVQTKTLTKENNSITFLDLPIENMGLYTIGESFNSLYIASDAIFNEETGHYEIINSLKDDVFINVSGTKTWLKDSESQRPESITINLLQNGTKVASTITNASKNWKYSFPKMPAYNHDGSTYNYTVEEVPVDRYITTYEPQYNGVAITFSDKCYTYSSSDYVYIYYNYNNAMYRLGYYSYNNLAGKVIELPTTDFYIYWHTSNSNMNYYGFSIDSIVNKQITTNPTTTISSLPNYEIEEVTHNNYPESLHNPYDNVVDKIWHYTYTSFDITNTRNTTDILGTKFWEGDTESQRPESITVKLLQDGVEYLTTTVTAETNWEYSFLDVPKFKNDGTKYSYTVEEIPVNRYVATYSTKNQGLAIKFNNQFSTESISYDWLEIYYVLDGTTYKLGRWGGRDLANKVLNIPTNDFYLYWHTDSAVCSYYGFSIDSIEAADVEHLSTTSTATLPSYTPEEITGDTYPDSAFGSYTHGNYGNSVNKVWHYTGDFSGAYDITNTRNSTNIFGIKTWEGDTELQRPESITIKLLQDGIEYSTTTVTAETNWEYSFLDVPEFRTDGSLYEYSVEELPVNGYTTKYGNDVSGVAITFNEQSLTEGASWDYVEIYYILEGTTYKLGKWGGTTTGSSECLAGKTIEVPSKDFYLYWRTDGSVNNYYGFSIDSIVPAEVEHLSTTTVATLPSYIVEEISGSTYPESPHSPYENSTNKIWHYTCTDVTYSDTPQPGIFKIVNIRSSVSAEINVKDFFTNEALTDVIFNLYKLVDTDTTHNHGIATENDCWDSVGTFTTNENGLLTLDNLSTDTIYGIVETTPDGYVVPNNTYWKMTVDSDQSITFETVGDSDDFYDRYGWTGYRLDIEASDDEYVLYNIPEFRTVEATKRIKASEINFYNGNPTFLFKLTGTDVSNTVRTYYQGVEFTEEYVSANTDSDGYVTITVVFEDLIKGTYTLSEEEISRYSIETISDVENGTASNTTVTFDLEDNTSGEATFTNKKYEFRWFSHNDFIINTIKAILDDEE